MTWLIIELLRSLTPLTGDDTSDTSTAYRRMGHSLHTVIMGTRVESVSAPCWLVPAAVLVNAVVTSGYWGERSGGFLAESAPTDRLAMIRGGCAATNAGGVSAGNERAGRFAPFRLSKMRYVSSVFVDRISTLVIIT